MRALNLWGYQDFLEKNTSKVCIAREVLFVFSASYKISKVFQLTNLSCPTNRAAINYNIKSGTQRGLSLPAIQLPTYKISKVFQLTNLSCPTNRAAINYNIKSGTQGGLTLPAFQLPTITVWVNGWCKIWYHKEIKLELHKNCVDDPKMCWVWILNRSYFAMILFLF